MIEIKKKYKISEITVKVNKRLLTYDFDFGRVIYTYYGTNKEEFKINYARWDKIVKRYKLGRDYSFCKNEELINDN